jgi:hypothetical protein
MRIAVRLRQETIQHREGLPLKMQQLIFGNLLKNDRTMADYNIEQEAAIIVGTRLSYMHHVVTTLQP